MKRREAREALFALLFEMSFATPEEAAVLYETECLEADRDLADGVLFIAVADDDGERLHRRVRADRDIALQDGVGRDLTVCADLELRAARVDACERADKAGLVNIDALAAVGDPQTAAGGHQGGTGASRDHAHPVVKPIKKAHSVISFISFRVRQ
jgi:hypothetical protein